MNLRLKSDFRDYYDHRFDLVGQEFQRVSTNGMNRVEMFKFLCNLDYVTVQHGFIDVYRPDDDFTSLHRVAIDFNAAPRIEGTGIEDKLNATEIVDLIKGAMV